MLLPPLVSHPELPELPESDATDADQMAVLTAVLSVLDDEVEEPEVVLPRFARDLPEKMPITDHPSTALQERSLPQLTLVLARRLVA